MYDEFTQASVGVSRTADGHGLGLAIVRYLVGVLEGSIQYRESTTGGAVFEIDLPAGDAEMDEDRRVGDLSLLGEQRIVGQAFRSGPAAKDHEPLT